MLRRKGTAKPASTPDQANAAAMQEERYEKRTFPMSWLLGFFRPHVGIISLSFLLAVLVNLSALAGPYLIKVVIDDHLTPRSGNMTALVALAGLYFAAAFLSAGLGYIQELLVARVGQKIIHTMRTGLFDKIQRLNMSFFDHTSSGRILTRLTSDIDAMSEMVSVLMVSLFVDGIMVIGIVGAMFLLSPTIAAAAMPVLPIIVASILGYKWFIKKNFVRLKAALARLNGFLAESINGMGIIKLFGREPEKNREFNALNERHFRLGLREVMLNTFSTPYMDMLNNIAAAFLLWVFAPSVIRQVVEIGVLYASITYLKRFFDPVINLVDQFTQIQSAFVSAGRIYSIMSLKDEEDYASGQPITAPLRGEIEFQHVWFAYEGDNYVIRDLSFHVRPGQSVAFVGSTGSGKSTVISLISRFYTVQKGKILLDGRDIQSYSLTDLRRRVAVILQEPFLFTGNVTSNITLGDGRFTDQQVRQAAALSGADHFISQLPGQYQSPVSERGKTFSAGQRQLISFARAAVTQPSIFILDEATASIDTETETAIQRAMETTCKGMTTITVAHRLSTVKDADCIYVLEHGKLMEHGNHDQLMAQGGIYQALYNRSIKEIVAGA